MPKTKPKEHFTNEDFKEKIASLAPQKLDTSQCTPTMSFYHQVLNNSTRRQKSEDRLNTQFIHLANGRDFSDPIQAASVLLEREYENTFLYDDTATSSIFIPPVFVSELYHKRTSVLEYDVLADINHTHTQLNASRPAGFWLTEEFDNFLASFAGKKITNGDLDSWLVAIQCVHLIRNYGPLPIPGLDIPKYHNTSPMLLFIRECVDYLNICDPDHQFTKEFISHQKKLKQWVKKMFEKKVSLGEEEDPIITWLFNLDQLSVSGDMVEHYLYDELKSVFGVGCRFGNDRFVVLYSMDIAIEDGKVEKHVMTEKEFDFLLVSVDHKLIVAIEAKRSIAASAFKQLTISKKIFEERFGDQLDDEWTFYPVVYVQENAELSDITSNHFIHPDTNMNQWMDDVLSDVHHSPVSSPTPKTTSIEQTRNFLKLMLFTLQLSQTKSTLDHSDAPKGTIVESKWAQYITTAIEVVSTADNILFYSKNQLPIFKKNDPRNKKLILFGGYGTGKTFLMREKAEILASRDNQKVLFIFGTCYEKKTLLQISLEERWKDPKYNNNITVLNKNDVLKGNGNKFITPTILLETMKSSGCHVFMDEWDSGDWNAELREELNKCKEFEDQYLWIAFHRLFALTVFRDVFDLAKTFHFVHLKHPMRNSKEIIQNAIEEGGKEKVTLRRAMPMELPSYNLPDGVQPARKGLHEDALDCVLDLCAKGRSVIMVVSFSASEIREVRGATIQYLSRCIATKRPSQPYAAYFCGAELQSIDPSFELVRLIPPEECLSYLFEKNAVLIVDDEAVEGFEFKSMFITVPANEYSMKANLYMRCIADLILLERFVIED